MRALQGTGWLIVGLVAAVVVPASGVARVAADTLGAFVPLPWSDIGLGMLVFWSLSALYFRDHWAASATALRRHREAAGTVAAKLDRIVEDGERWTSVLGDNLAELASPQVHARQSELYLGGAAAHARKLAEAFERCAGASRELRHLGQPIVATPGLSRPDVDGTAGDRGADDGGGEEGTTEDNVAIGRST